MKKDVDVNRKRRDIPPGKPSKHGSTYTLEEIGCLLKEMDKIPSQLLSIKQMEQLNEQMREALVGVINCVDSVKGKDIRAI